MKKYTIEEFKQGKKAVWIDSLEEHKRVKDLLGLANYNCRSYYSNDGMYDSGTERGGRFVFRTETYETLDFSQLVFDEEFVLTDDWQVSINKDNAELIRDFFNRIQDCKNWRTNEILEYKTIYKTLGDTKHHLSFSFDVGYPKLTDSQFKEHVLKQPKMEKEIIGYNAKEEFNKSEIAKMLCGTERDAHFDYWAHKNSFVIEKAKNLKVLDLWFEPVYREDKKLPVINGKEGSYKKGEKVVVYGNNCAKLFIPMLEKAFELRLNIGGNREIKSITLDSGVSITMDQIGEILDYVKFVNEQ